MRIAITGANGFLGKYTVAAAEAAGHEVLALGHYGNGNYKDTDGDLCSYGWLHRQFRNFRPEAAIHLASLIDVPRSFLDPHWYEEVVTRGTERVSTALVATIKKCRLVYVSSSEVYGKVGFGTRITEKHGAAPTSPYADAKLRAEWWVANHYSGPLVILRPFNAFGPGQSQRAVLPSIARQIVCNGKVVFGNNSTRTWTHARDLARAFVLAAEGKCGTDRMRSRKSRTFNVGAPWENSVLEAACYLAQLSGTNVPIEYNVDGRTAASEVPWLWCDASKFEIATGWAPQTTFEDGLMEVLAEARAAIR